MRKGPNGASTDSLYRYLPNLNELLQRDDVSSLCTTFSRSLVLQAAREALNQLRHRIQTGDLDQPALETALGNLPVQIVSKLQGRLRPSLRRVINATGVILQTNLGRAPLSEHALERIQNVARGYCNLEFDLVAGERSRRDVHADALLLDLLRLKSPARAPDLPTLGAAVVNNCVAATFLALNTLAEGGEVIVSRGELVEIGGGFRIPEILAKSGAILREVGTTNKTRVSDYASAIGPATKLILKVHRSNFRIEGFTEQPSLEQLVALGKQTSVPVFDDQGTGCVLDLAALGLPGESSWLHSIGSGASLVAASGDKLLGGPQCGLLMGGHPVIERLRANPLFRALRVDKLTYAALEATLLAYLTGAEDTLPVARMLLLPAEQIRTRCESLAASLRSDRLHADVIPTRSVVGGGTTPGASLPSFAVALQQAGKSDDSLASFLRGLETPVVARVNEGRVLLDLRTVAPEEDGPLTTLLQEAFREAPAAESEA